MHQTVLVVENLWWPFGAHLLHMKWAYIYALIHGYDFYYKYNASPVFKDGKVDYYFKSANTVNEEEINKKKLNYYIPNHSLKNIRGNFVPSEFENAEEFHSFILKKIYNPTEHIKQLINSNYLVQMLKCDNIKYIALHIRLGDKVSGSAKETDLIPLDQYYEKCKEVKEKYGTRTIVVCSDTSCGLEEFISFNTNDEFQILFNNETRSKNVYDEALVQKVNRGYNDKEKLESEYINCFINYELLLNSEIIIGNWDSCFCLVPVEIRNNKKDININNTNTPIWGICK